MYKRQVIRRTSFHTHHAPQALRAHSGPVTSTQMPKTTVSSAAAADVPIIYASVFFWRTQHPKATVVRSLQKEMLPAFFVSLGAFTVLFVALLLARLRLESSRRALDAAHLEADDAGLFD